MVGKRRQIRLRYGKILGFSLGFAIIAASIPVAWHLSAADLPVNAVTSKATKFHFARMRYPGGIPDFIKNWYTDYPNMDSHLTTLLRRQTIIDVGPPLLVDPVSPALFDYPIIYSVEPEQMVLGPREVNNLREYLTRGGLWFADDFHGDEEFEKFMVQLRRVIPDAKPVELTTAHPLFHCFYDIDWIVQVTNDSIAKCPTCDQWENGPSGRIPKVFAVFDGRGRIIVLLAWNTDLGDGLEWADDPDYPGHYSAYAFKFITNVIVYAMSH